VQSDLSKYAPLDIGIDEHPAALVSFTMSHREYYRQTRDRRFPLLEAPRFPERERGRRDV
jgi:hypothetical protein